MRLSGNAPPNAEKSEWIGRIVDSDVSKGECRAVRVLSNRLIVLSYTNDAFPDSHSVEVAFRPAREMSPRRCCLSPNGKFLAAAGQSKEDAISFPNSLSEAGSTSLKFNQSRIDSENPIPPNRLIEIFDVEDLVDLSKPGIVRDSLIQRGVRVQPESIGSFSIDGEVMCMEFTPDGSSLLVGDDNGSISIFDCSTGELKNRIAVPGRARGRNKWTVSLVLGLWVLLGVGMFAKRAMANSGSE